MKFLQLTPDLETEIINVECTNDREVLKVLQKGVGGWIERATHFFPLPDGVEAWVNEEGLYSNLLPVLRYRCYSPSGLESNGYLVGNVMFSGGEDEQGNPLDLSDEQIERVQALLNGMPKAEIQNSDTSEIRPVLLAEIG